MVQVMAATAAAKLLRKMSPAIAAAALTMRASTGATCGRVAAPDTRSVAVGISPTLEAEGLQAMTNSLIQAACTRSVAVGTSPTLEAGGLKATTSTIQAAVQAAVTAAAEQAGSALQRKCEVLQAALSEQVAAAAQHHRHAHQQLGQDVTVRFKALQEAQGQQLGQIYELAQQQGMAQESLQQGLSQLLTALKAQAQTKQRPALEQSPRPDITTHGEHKPQAGADAAATSFRKCMFWRPASPCCLLAA